MSKIILYTDGGARGNPGVAGAGAIIVSPTGEIVAKLSKPLGVATNNEAEYQGALLGLEAVKKMYGRDKLATFEVEHRLDSELVAKQLRGEYQIKEERLWPWFIKIWNLRVAEIPHLSFVHVPRADNALADKLANEAMDEQGTKQSSLI